MHAGRELFFGQFTGHDKDMTFIRLLRKLEFRHTGRNWPSRQKGMQDILVIPVQKVPGWITAFAMFGARDTDMLCHPSFDPKTDRFYLQYGVTDKVVEFSSLTEGLATGQRMAQADRRSMITTKPVLGPLF